MSRRLLPESETFKVGGIYGRPVAWTKQIALEIEELKLLKLESLTFPITWDHILPSGRGPVIDQKTLDTYDRWIDELLIRNITPRADLTTRLLPETLQDKGGWTNRDAIYWFADYTRILAQKLGDRILDWTTHTDPFLASKTQYRDSLDADFQKPVEAWKASHHILLAHPHAREAITAERPEAKVGFGLKYWPVYPASDRTRDHLAAERFTFEHHSYYLDLLYLGKFSEGALHLGKYESGNLEFLLESDRNKIHNSADFLELDYQFMPVIDVNDPESHTRKGKLAHKPKPKTEPYTDRKSSERLVDSLESLNKAYDPKSIHLHTEQREQDEVKSLLYHTYHLQAVKVSLDKEIPIKSYAFKNILDFIEKGEEAQDRSPGFYWLKAAIATRDPVWEAGVNYKDMD